MKLLILLFAISRLSECSLVVPLGVAVAYPEYHGVTVGITPYSAPVNSHSQYHAQDIHGHYAYGYATDLSAQDEVKTADGVTRGGYSYIDANGILQNVQYVSDPVHGFRVAATNLPRDLPEVAAARAQHLAQFEYIKAEHAAIAASRAHLPAIISPVPAPGAYVVPVRAAAVAAPAFAPPVVAVSSQYQAQDSHGQYSYGYADPNSAKSETKTADGVTRGGYSYIDANGILQTVQYVSDPVNGFRVAATNLPQAPSVTLIGPKVTATVVGPQDNAAGVAVAPSVQTHIDSIAVEQRPVLAEADIVQNANVPLVSPVGAGPYIHPNPNHEPVAVLANPELAAPFYPASPQYVDVPNQPQYSPAPIPVTHSQAVLHNQEPVYAAPPALENVGPQYANAYPIPHPDGGALISPDYPSQILRAPESHGQIVQYQQIASDHRGQLLVDPNYGPIPAQYAPEQRGHIYADSNVQIPQDHQALLADPRNHILAANPRGHNLAADPRDQILVEDPRAHYLNGDSRGHNLAADPRGQILLEDPRVHNFNGDSRGHNLPADPRGQILVEDPRAHYLNGDSRGHNLHADPRGQILLEDPRVHNFNVDPRGQIVHADERSQIVAADPRGHHLADGNLQALGNPNVHQGAYSHEVAPSPDYGRNYQLPIGPINADTINNGPINQQVLNHEEGPARLALFLPGGGDQQVHGHRAPVGGGGGGGAQVATPEQQAFIVRVAEHDSADTDAAGDKGVTPPSGYYTQNIQY